MAPLLPRPGEATATLGAPPLPPRRRAALPAHLGLRPVLPGVAPHRARTALSHLHPVSDHPVPGQPSRAVLVPAGAVRTPRPERVRPARSAGPGHGGGRAGGVRLDPRADPRSLATRAARPGTGGGWCGGGAGGGPVDLVVRRLRLPPGGVRGAVRAAGRP